MDATIKNKLAQVNYEMLTPEQRVCLGLLTPISSVLNELMAASRIIETLDHAIQKKVTDPLITKATSLLVLEQERTSSIDMARLLVYVGEILEEHCLDCCEDPTASELFSSYYEGACAGVLARHRQLEADKAHTADA